MITNKGSVQLSDYCFNAREALKTTIEEGSSEDLNEFVRVALKNLERCVD